MPEVGKESEIQQGTILYQSFNYPAQKKKNGLNVTLYIGGS